MVTEHSDPDGICPHDGGDCNAPVSVVVAGQRLTLFFTSNVQRELMLEDLRTATRRIWVETYIFQNDDFGQAFADVLIEKARAGVDVRVHYDSAGSYATPGRFFSGMQVAGVKVHAFHSAWESLHGFSFFETYNCRNHRKVLIIDDRLAYFGGMNIVNHDVRDQASEDYRLWTSNGWRDVHVRVDGPLQQHLAASFQLAWNKALESGSDDADLELRLPDIPSDTMLTEPKTGYPVSFIPQTDPDAAHDEWIRVFDSGTGPASHRAARVFTHLIKAARFRLWFSMCYFLPVGRVRRALVRAGKRGRHVRVVLSGVSDMPLIRRASRFLYSHLLKHRIEVYERRDRMLHSKVLIVDDDYVVLGSSNFDVRSLWINWELLVLIRSRRLVSILSTVVSREISHSHQVLESQCEKLSFWERSLDRIAFWFRSWL